MTEIRLEYQMLFTDTIGMGNSSVKIVVDKRICRENVCVLGGIKGHACAKIVRSNGLGNYCFKNRTDYFITSITLLYPRAHYKSNACIMKIQKLFKKREGLLLI